MATYLINGVNYSWADVKFVLFGIPVRGITSISAKKKQEKTNNYGASSEPISRGYGRSEYEASIELYKDEWQAVIAASPNKDPLAIPAFEIQVIYGSSRNAVVGTDVWHNCEFLEDPFSTKEGDTKIVLSIPMIIAGITHL